MQILIAGLAKTGTTGLLYLLNNSLSRTPKLLFEPKTLPPELFAQHPDLLAKVIIGDHLDVQSLLPFKHKITLVRDPRDRLVSALLYSQYHAGYLADDAKVGRVRELLERKERTPRAVSIGSILETLGEVSGKPARAASQVRHLNRQMETFARYCEATPDALLYKYEDFVGAHYAALENYLGMPIQGQAIVPETLKRVERTKDSGGWRHWFTDEDVAAFRPILEPVLARYHYDAQDWSLAAEPVIEPQHASQYYIRLVEESRAKACQVGAASARAVATGPQRNMGIIQRTDTDAVVGWAIGLDASEPVHLVLKINGREVARALANEPRPALAERGVHPTGRCGFAFRFSAGQHPRVGDEVIVEPVGAAFALRNSPRTVTAAAARS